MGTLFSQFLFGQETVQQNIESDDGVITYQSGRYLVTEFHDKFDDESTFGRAVCDFYGSQQQFGKTLDDYVKNIIFTMKTSVIIGWWYNLLTHKFEFKHGTKDEYFNNYTYHKVYDNNEILVSMLICNPSNTKEFSDKVFKYGKWKKIDLWFTYRTDEFKQNSIMEFDRNEMHRLKHEMRAEQMRRHAQAQSDESMK
eukprot:UN11507